MGFSHAMLLIPPDVVNRDSTTGTPEVSRGLVAAKGKAGDFQAAVQAAEAATVMVLVFE